MPKKIVFVVRMLDIDGQVQARERVRASLETWPKISVEVEWPRIQQKLQDFRRKRGWHCKIKFHNGTELEDLCDPSSLRNLLEVQHETLLHESVDLPLYLFSDPTSGTSSLVKDEKEIVFEIEEKGSPILLNLQSDLQLGEGGFGTVWRARNGKDHIALKVARPKNLRSQQSMKTEICTLLQLNHSNIIKVLQHGYVLDPVNGRLPAYMMDLGRCSVAALLETGWHTKAAAEAARRDVGSALQHFHSAGLGHMDVKPGNLLVTNKCTATSGEIQLTLTLIDAGVAGRLNEDEVTSFTVGYAHPLQRQGSTTETDLEYFFGYSASPELVVPWKAPLQIQAFYDWYGLLASIFQLSRYSEDGVLAEASEALANDKEFTLKAVRQDRRALSFASKTLRSDKEVVMEAVKQDGWALQFASETLCSDKEVVMEAVREYGRALRFASETLQSDKEVVMEAVRQDGSALELASKTLRSDKEVFMEFVRKKGYALKYASETLRSDKEVVMEAVRQAGCLLRFSSKTLRSDKEVVMEAVRHDGRALEFANETLRSNKEVVMEAVRQDGRALIFARDTLQSDKEVVMEAVRQAGCLLRFYSETLCSDKEVVMEAVRNDGCALEFASETLRSDKEVVMEAVWQNGYALAWASETLRNDKEVVMEAVRQHWRALKFASEALRNDKEVFMEAVRHDGRALEFASETLQSDKELVMEAVCW
eukprot:s4414_g1.t1